MLEIRDILQIIRRGFWIILLIPAIAVIATLIIDKSEIPTYRSSTRLLINADKTALSGRDLIYTYAALEQATIIPTFVEIANSERILTNSIAALNLREEALEIYGLSAVAIPGASVLELSAQGPSPAIVQRLANAAGQKMIEYVSQFYNGYTIEVLDSAPFPASPVDPNPVRDATVAAVLGLVVGGILAALTYYWQQLNASVKDDETYDVTSSAFTRSYLMRQLDESADGEIDDASLGIMKLNGLSALNGVLSRSVYTRVLHYAVNQIRDELRGKDIVARWGDDSFAIFTPDLSLEDASRLLEAIREKLERPQMVPAAGRLVYFDPHVRMLRPSGESTTITQLQVAEAELANTQPNGSKLVQPPSYYRKAVDKP